ncbi:hypothetical protein PFMC_06016, partial [Plasmodium falciparum CAMP/Malaysia]
MKEISEKIEEILKNGDKKPGQPTTQKDWWEKNGERIWEGMICALTYTEEEGPRGQPLKQNESLKDKLIDKKTGKPQKNGDNDYTYENVELQDQNDGRKGGDNPKLSDFVKLPPFFRWLHEWGESFCRERAKRLAQIKKECAQDDKPCSGYGEDCKDQLSDDPSTDADLKCPSCATPCGLYKRWIGRKKIEFDKQEKAYNEQKAKCQTQSNGDQGNKAGNVFCGTLENYKEAKEFLQKLGSCSKNENGVGKTVFENTEETFQHAKDCNPCSKFNVNCKKAKCTSADKKVTCNGNNGGTTTITAKDIENKTDVNNIVMLVSDNVENVFEHVLDECVLGDCKSSGIFKGFRKEQWKCGKVCGYVVCKSENGNGRENQNKIITIRGLVEHWVHNFLEDYNKIRKKLNLCVKNRKDPKCIKYCVDTWINEKRKEWQQITERLNEQYKNDNQPDYSVKTILEELIPKIAVVNDQDNVIKLS